MIVEYHRPSTVVQALEILSRPNPKSLPLGGGSVLSRKRDEDFAVVDLQSLGLDTIQTQAGKLILGATVRLQTLVEDVNSPVWLKAACLREAGRNNREMSTIAGLLVCANGRSPLAIALLAADVTLTVLPGGDDLNYPGVLAARKEIHQPWLISRAVLDDAVEVKFEFIARSPADLPVLGIAIAKWDSGRLRVTVGGFGDAPVLAYDGIHSTEIVSAVDNALQDSDDEWASAEYRQSIAPALVKRLLEG